MTMDIDITDKKSREIIRILTMYPYGRLETKYERVFWCTDSVEPDLPGRSEGSPGDRGAIPRGPTVHDRAKRALDTLGSMMGPPAR